VTEPRVIKKYPNRRLYDTEVSSYVTLEDVRHLVLEEVPFTVREAKSNDDITRSILLQIIMEQEEDGEPIFSEQILSQIIRFYGDSLQGMVTSYLERSVALFVDQHSKMQEQMRSVMTVDPLAMLRDVTEQTLAMWNDMQQRFFRAAMPPSSGSGTKKRKGGGPGRSEGDPQD